MPRDKEGGWFSRRSYSHFDYPLDFGAATKITARPASVAKRQFLPLVGFTEKKRRFRTDNSDRTIPRKKRRIVVTNKEREIRYAAHGDAAVYQFYAASISRYYESFLASVSLNDCVIGYRSGKGSNIEMAAEVFTEIALRGDVTALCFDVENFFPSIQHQQLKRGLCTLLQVQALPDDWYHVFRSITKYAWIDLDDLAIVEGFNAKAPPFPLVVDINAALNRCRNAQIIKTNSNNFGIPQGTPFSAVAANTAMIDFDIEVKKFIDAFNGLYRRYSDDILILVPPSKKQGTIDFIIDAAIRCGLSINSSKTEISDFSVKNGRQQADRPISYLGFCFDGTATTLRPSTLSRYYRSMTYATRSAVRGAAKKGQFAPQTFKRGLFSDFTHLGRRNFYSYSRRAHGALPASAIRKQMKNHFRILLRKLHSRGR